VKKILCLILLLLLGQVSAMDPPEMEWEMQYFPTSDYAALFRDVQQMPDECFVQAGYVGSAVHAFLVKVDQCGDTLWTVGNDEWSFQDAYSVEVLDSGGCAVTGACMEQPSSSTGLFIFGLLEYPVSSWFRIYDHPGTTERGYGITALPDGGFCITGVNYSVGRAQAWILRTDSEGDTLWTDLWGYSTPAYAKQALYQDGELVVLVRGLAPELPNGLHLLFYDLDGNYLFGTSYPGVGGHASDICHAPDGGYTFVTTGCIMVHTNDLGNLLWVTDREQTDEAYNNSWSSINPTMDGGYIVAGRWAYQSPPMNYCQECSSSSNALYQYRYGWLLRFDSEGSPLWEILLNPGGSDEVEFYSARQLAQGGYIASGYYNDVGGTGVDGYIVRYAPETGIEEWEESTGETLSLRSWPNPASGPVQISLTGPEGLYSLTVHDLAERLVREYPEVPLGGAATLVWDGLSDSGTPLPAGVYIARLQTVSGTVSTLLMRF
jgi:hypothetical protein